MTCRLRLIKASQNFIRFCLFSHRTPFIFLHSVKTWCWKFETKSFGENYLYTLKTAQFFQASKRSEHMVNVIMASWFFSLSFITHARKVLTVVYLTKRMWNFMKFSFSAPKHVFKNMLQGTIFRRRCKIEPWKTVFVYKFSSVSLVLGKTKVKKKSKKK